VAAVVIHANRGRHDGAEDVLELRLEAGGVLQVEHQVR
jgi:hypothetical protein